ncbi:metalloregulator ArsR/SmtB family transcription factor [Hymenobacter seoulensis]|uniref:ArsR/SmtB family transcription factor n=1 Tax=unclassified Hymenobacter TaxID=2615202 RepID=UPI0016519596|nr:MULTISPECIES: metalloregulator ArsR/SmtB family transcription factor [unclassified Hymenobacter]MBC6700288.1 winged helix-turn-helix transcriptional regulator [Hymenobacter sp. BT190]MCR5890500.1 metalloregulator ArsR/SmtB family transcription factor [Hymenobacter sp. J193]MCR5890596.1 metalloregulator ArsR/SmtB family transcription factor [Hymenobacter sp. J193]
MTSPTCIRVFADTAHIEQSKHRLAAAEPELQSLAAVLALAGNEVRLKMLFLLLDKQQLCVCDLADVLQMNVSAISQHLRKLKDGGVIQARKVGQTVFYSLSAAHLSVLQPLLTPASTSASLTPAR